MSDLLPKLQFSFNKPVSVLFHYDPNSAKRLEGEYKGAPTVSYSHKVLADGVEHIWFATQKMHDAIMNAGCVAKMHYLITKEEVPGTRAYNLIITEDSNQQASVTSDNAVKPLRSENKSKRRDPQTLGMCFKMANGNEEMTKQLYDRFQDLANEEIL